MWLFKRDRGGTAANLPRSVPLPATMEPPLRLASRAEFLRAAADAIERARQNGGSCAVVAWELRPLPGEAIDPETAVRSARLLVQRLRAEDVVTRYDERHYLALAAEADDLSARSAAFRLKRDLGLAFPDAGKWLAGTAAYPRDGETPAELIRAALADLEEDLWR
jgi:hypothetical protein